MEPIWEKLFDHMMLYSNDPLPRVRSAAVYLLNLMIPKNAPEVFEVEEVQLILATLN